MNIAHISFIHRKCTFGGCLSQEKIDVMSRNNWFHQILASFKRVQVRCAEAEKEISLTKLRIFKKPKKNVDRQFSL